MVTEQNQLTETKHDSDKEDEEEVVSRRRGVLDMPPEVDEVNDRRCNYVHTVQSSPEEKDHKILVVVKTDTIVDPRAVVIHLEEAAAARRTMMTSIGFDYTALWTCSNETRVACCFYG